MTLDDVLQELIEVLSPKGDDTVSWEQVREWPEGAIEIFQNAGWIKPKTAAKAVVCPGCEENCFMPVHVSPAVQGKSFRAYVACDQKDDMGRIPIAPQLLQQWQITENQVAQWVANTLELKEKPKKDKKSGTIYIGEVRGKKRTNLLEFIITEQASLKSSGHSLPLIEAVYLKGSQLQIDRAVILNMVDRAPLSNQYEPSIARREVRKLDTQKMYESWRKAYRELKRTRRNMSDVWYSQQIAKKDIAQGRDSETIRKEMKKLK